MTTMSKLKEVAKTAGPAAAGHPAFATGVLDPNVHGRLVANRHAILARAGLGPANEELLWTNAGGVLNAVERGWMINVIRQASPTLGLLYENDAEVLEKMKMMTAAFLRHFVDARLMMLEQLIKALIKDDEEPENTVLLVPDLTSATKPLTDGVAAVLAGCLRARAMRGEFLVLGVHAKGKAAQLLGLRHGDVFDELTNPAGA